MLHNPSYDFNDDLIPLGATYWVRLAEAWLADLVSEALSTRAGVPLIPYAKGYAIGNVMSMRVSDGDVYNLKLPKPDYEISVALTNLVKKPWAQVASRYDSMRHSENASHADSS